jgi:hypothetical protein
LVLGVADKPPRPVVGSTALRDPPGAAPVVHKGGIPCRCGGGRPP